MPDSPTAFSIGDLLIGTATSALQIEGGNRANTWYDFAQVPGRIADGSTPLVATDHWNRWREDVDLMADLGLQVYRMGIEWARLEPRPGVFDAHAIEHYRAELGALGAGGIRPLVTLHHFTNPSWFEAAGGWVNPQAPEIFDRFVRYAASHLGDLVTDWCTINEPNVYATGGWLFGEFPPARRNAILDMRKVLRHMAIAHCTAYRSLKEQDAACRVGFAHHLRVFDPLDPSNRLHRALSRVNAHLFQDILSAAFLGGRFGPELGGQPASVSRGPHHDYLGINYYSRTAVSRMADGTFPDSPVNDLGWEIHPEGLVTVARALHERYPAPIWVTENGTADNTESFRSRYIHDHLAAIAGSGLPFERYYHWCFVDNWEWAEGFVPRFGIVAQDGPGGERTVKESGRFLAEVVRCRGVTSAAHARWVAPQQYRFEAQPHPHG